MSSKRIAKIQKEYRDRLDCPIDTEGVADGDGYFVDLKDGWTFDFEGAAGAFSTLDEVEDALKKATKVTT